MIAEKIKNDTSWEKEFQKRFIGFLKKSPVMFTVQIKIQNNQKGALVKHQNTGLTYFFPFDYSEDVKQFIYKIKSLVSERHYPRLIEEVYLNRESTSEDLAIAAEKGQPLEKYTIQRLGTRTYIMDKVLLWKSLFILKLEESTFKDDQIGELWRYKYQGSGMLFLKNYRTNKFGSIEAASEHFFTNSLLISQIFKKDEAD